jgi:FtsP/CotA-like multicopper oxidase with cupredoxin domain
MAAPVFLLSGCGPMEQTVKPVTTVKSMQPLMGAILDPTLDCSGTGLYQELMAPPVINAKNLHINTQLSAKLVDKCVNGKKYSLQSYIDKNAGIDTRAVGPTYSLDVAPNLPGPRLDIQFTNELGDKNRPDPYECHGKDVKLCTNLHVHGLHVSPHGSDDPARIQSDYVFLTISPATQTVSYQYAIPNYHPPGTHWLHSHLHGSTAPQVKNGMAGALILKGALDKTLADNYGITADKDKIMVLQQMATDSNNTPLCGASNGNTITTSINGQCLPIITVKAGDIQRWRFIDAGISASINLAVIQPDGSKLNLHEFARDGITMNGTQIQQNIMLQPGYRSDVLLQFPACTAYPCELFLIDDASPAKASLMGVTEPSNQIAKVVIQENTGAAMTMPPSQIFTNPYPFVCAPADFKACSERLAAQEGPQKVWFANISNPATGGVDKTVNNDKTYTGVYPNTATKNLALGGSNTWKLWVDEKQGSSGVNHPFHIHVNPFQVIDSNGFSYWKDTLLVSGTDNLGESNALTVVSRYDNFDGKFVLHCHNLTHEDQGMMMNVIINP